MNFGDNLFVLCFRGSQSYLWVWTYIAVVVLPIFVEVHPEHFPARATHPELQPNVLSVAIVNTPFCWHGQRVYGISSELKLAFRFVQPGSLGKGMGKAWDKI